MYKMICIDIDGTLVQPDLSVSRANAEAIAQAKAKGVVIALSTGRMHRSALAYADELQLTDPIISSNGAYVRSKEGNEVYYEQNLSTEDLRFLVKTLEKFDTKINFYDPREMFISEVRDYVLRYERAAATLPENRRIAIRYLSDSYTMEDFIAERGGKIQKGIVFPRPDRIEAIREAIGQNPSIRVVSSGEDNLEFTSRHADKGKGVLALAKVLNIQPEEIIAVGDSENDLAMLRVAGMPVAMGNAAPEVKAAAKYVTGTNLEDGVARMIHRFVLEENPS